MSSESSVREQVLALNEGQRIKLAALLKDRSRGRLVAFVQTGDTETHRDWTSELSDRLPRHMIPTSVTAVDGLPRLPNGKVDRGALPATALSAQKELAPKRLPDKARAVPSDDGPNETEAALMAIWQELLGFDEITLEDDFFEIGGDSLLSIQLLSRANTAGLELLPSDLTEEVSIRRLSDFSQQRQASRAHQGTKTTGTSPSGSDDRESLVDKDSSRGCLVHKIHSGTGSGSVMLMHDFGGDVQFANHLIEPFTKSCDLYASRLSQSGSSAETVEEMAANVLQEWLRHSPSGPLFVVAYCSGALLAYELSSQLKEQGHPTGGLFVIEAKIEGAFAFATRTQRALARSRGVLRSTRDRLADLVSARSLDELKKVVPGRIRKKFRASFSPVPASDDVSQPNPQNLNAYYNYQPKPAHIAVCLFRVRNQVQIYGGSYIDESYGWTHLAQDHFQAHLIPGEHFTCLQLPHVNVLSAKLNELIETTSRVPPQ